MGALTNQQRQRYREAGYLLVSGLIPPEIFAGAETALWRALGASPDDPNTWRGRLTTDSHTDPAILACYTPEFCQAAAELAEESADGFHPPARVMAINVFPQEDAWNPPVPHIDHAIKEHGHRTFPRPLRVATITYLNAVQPRGGGTFVWPGSHQKIEALARSNPERYALMWQLNQDLSRLDLGEPLEILGRPGDALFYHYLCAHSGSQNVGTCPRLAILHKW